MNAIKGADARAAFNSLLTLLRGVALIILALVAHIVYYGDLAIQKLAVALRIPRLAPRKYSTPDSLRAFNRVVIAALTIVIIFFTVGYEYKRVVEDVEVPILGSGESPVFGYYPPIGDSFYPQVPYYNQAPKYRPRTPLLIPFTRNHTMMRQTILSYIAGGWPRSDIIIVDNSGTMDANPRRQLSPSNPFFLDFDMYRRKYGVSIIQTPTLLNFAQLQNFMLRIAIGRDWPYYFWTHMDVAVLGAEEIKPYKPFYHRILDVLDASGVNQWAITSAQSGLISGGRLGIVTPSNDKKGVFAGEFERGAAKEPEMQAKKSKRSILKPSWGVKFFAYDYLSLVNVQAWKETGAWDPYIPYYNTDCDYYQRMAFAGYRVEKAQAGHLYDVAEAIADPEERFFPARNQRARNKWGVSSQGKEPENGELNSGRYQWLKSELEEMMERKLYNSEGRNTWQKGGFDDRKPDKHGVPVRQSMEPWTYDPRAFQAAWWAMADAGRVIYIKKWGTMDCDLKGAKKTINDMWMSQYLEEGTELYNVREKQEAHYLSKLHEKDVR